MDQASNCVQFYVKNFNESASEDSNADLFVLHLDEVDVSGICQSQMNCSLKPSASVCKNNNCNFLIKKAKDFFPEQPKLILGQET